MTTAEQLGKAIIELRGKKQVSQETMAYEAGIGRRYMSDLENGKRNPSLDVIERVARYFGISLSELFAIAEKIK